MLRRCARGRVDRPRTPGIASSLKQSALIIIASLHSTARCSSANLLTRLTITSIASRLEAPADHFFYAKPPRRATANIAPIALCLYPCLLLVTQTTDDCTKAASPAYLPLFRLTPYPGSETMRPVCQVFRRQRPPPKLVQGSFGYSIVELRMSNSTSAMRAGNSFLLTQRCSTMSGALVGFTVLVFARESHR